MANQDIVNFISAQITAGYTEAQIREALKAKGWQDSDIDMAFSAWKANPVLNERKNVSVSFYEVWDYYKVNYRKFLNVIWLVLKHFGQYIIPGIIFFILVYATNVLESMTYIFAPLAIVVGIGLYILFLFIAVWIQVSWTRMLRGENYGCLRATSY